MMSSRSLSEDRASRSVSYSSRPRALTVRAPSKLSWAMPLTSPRLRCTASKAAKVRHEPRRSTAMIPARPTRVIRPSTASIQVMIPMLATRSARDPVP